MTEMVAQMTKDELREMISETIEQKLLKLFGAPDQGLEMHQIVRDRLLRQQQAGANGERDKTPIAVKDTNGDSDSILIEKSGFLIAQVEPLEDLTDIVGQDRRQRLDDLILRIGL